MDYYILTVLITGLMVLKLAKYENDGLDGFDCEEWFILIFVSIIFPVGFLIAIIHGIDKLNVGIMDYITKERRWFGEKGDNQ